MYDNQLPVTTLRDAMKVIDTRFDVNKYPEAYVKFEDLRAENHLGALKVKLNIFDDELDSNSNYAKVIFTGHTGSGKTTELRKLSGYLNHANRYFTVFADVQDSFEISTFEQEDLFVLLIAKMVEALEAKGIAYNKNQLNDLAKEWIVGDKEIEEEIRKAQEGQVGLEAEAEANIGFAFWKLFSIKGTLKTMFSYQSSTSTKVRQKIKQHKGEYIARLNLILRDIRLDIIKAGLGKDVLFMIDGIERLRNEKYEVYLTSFFRDARLLQELSANLICCVPIETRYDILTFSSVKENYKTYELPLIEVSEKSVPYFHDMIAKRIDVNLFFEPEVLNFLIEQSGGHPRQLLQLAESSLTYAINQQGKISMDAAQKACEQAGRSIRRLLTTQHVDVLNSGEYSNADKVVLELLYSWSLFEYNGTTNVRKINPVLAPFIHP
jgi:energy-coupling factor transporter ATP-binding protein EcfA2